jgi:cytochrome c biogenesis protein CcmG/thiol:disulfide interchange protein DsbE
MTEQVQETVSIPGQGGAEPGWERWTRGIGVAFVALVVLSLVGLLAWGVLFKKDPGSGPTRLSRPAPDFTVNLFDGGAFTLSQNRGKPVVVNFWASWCDACREEAPVLEQAWQKFKDQGVIFLGVDIQDKREDALKFIDEFNVTYPNGPDEGNTYFDYGGTGVPESYFIDRDGKIVLKYIGALNENQMDSFVGEILK